MKTLWGGVGLPKHGRGREIGEKSIAAREARLLKSSRKYIFKYTFSLERVYLALDHNLYILSIFLLRN